jgi:hypothetical protein
LRNPPRIGEGSSKILKIKFFQMKKRYLKISILSLIFAFAFATFSFAQVTLSLRYSNADSKYHVYLTATQALSTTPNPKLTDGSSVITVMAPTSGASATPLTIGTVTSVSPVGIWFLDVTHRNNGDLVSVIGGSPAPQNTDFFVFVPSGDFTSINYTVGQEVELFNFDVTGTCTGNMDLLSSGGQTAGGQYNIGSYYSVKGYPGGIGTNHFSSTYNMVAACPVASASDLITSIGQPATPFVAGSPSNVPVTITNIGTAPDAGVITTTITLPAGFSTPSSFSPIAGTTCATSGQVVTCTTAGPLSNTAPNNTKVFDLPITPAASTVGTKPTTTATTGSPNEPVANTPNNPATPMQPTTPVAAAAAPDLVTTIGQPLTPFVAGSPSNVPVTIKNQGTAPDGGPITTNITLPAGFSTPATFSPAVGTTCSTSGQAVTCTTAGPLSNVAPNNTTTFNLPITPAASTVGTTPPTTGTTSSPNEPATNTGNNPAAPMQPTTPVAAATAPDVVTTIGQPLPVLVVGQTSNLPVTVTNQGSAPATGPITTTITLPAGVTTSPVFVSNGFTCSTAGQLVTCFTAGPLTNIAPNNAVTIQVPVTPDATIVGTSPVFNASTAVPNEPAATLPNNTSTPTSTTSPVAAAPASNIVVTVGQPATPFVAGSPSNVSVTISNVGNLSDAGAFTSTITLPTGFSTTPGIFSPVAGTTCSTVGQVVTCTTAGPLSSVVGSNTKAFNLPITPAASTVGTTPTTNVSVSSPNEPAVNAANNTGSMWPTTPVAAAPASDLVTTIGQPLTPFVAGSPSNVPVTIKNQGTAPDGGPITTNITLPAGFSTPSIFSPVAGTTCTTSGQNVICTTAGPLSNVAPNNTTTFNLPITPAASTVGTTPPTTGTTSSPNEPATNTGNNPATPMQPTTPVAAAPAPDLVTFVGQPATPFVAGTPSNVPVTIVNQGTAPANGPVTVTITLPVGFSAPPSFNSNGSTCTTTGQIVSCSNPNPLSNIAPGNSSTILVPVTPAASTVGTTPPTTATSSAPNEPATSTGNNPATPMQPTTPVAAAAAPDLVTTIGQPTTPFVAGTPSIVPVTVTNIGTAPATGPINTTITLPIGTSAPATFSPVAGTTCTTTGQIVFCSTTGPLSQTAPNNAIVINVPVTPAASTVGTNPGPFTATPTAPNEPNTNTGNNAAAPMTPITPVSAPAVVSVQLNVKLFLQGAYDQSTGLMRDDLRNASYFLSYRYRNDYRSSICSNRFKCHC